MVENDNSPVVMSDFTIRTRVAEMTGFSINMSSPIAPESFTQGYGGPNTGGHQPTDWYIQYGMDLGASPGAEVRAAFDGHITRLNPHVPSSDTSKVYGAQIFIRY